MIATHITDLIGNTPVLLLPESLHGLRNVDVYVKLELFNPFGSIKDRVAWAMLRDDLDSIAARRATVIESSSGNTAKALHLLCQVAGVPFRTVTNRIKVDEVKQLLQAIGMDIRELPGASDCYDPDDPNDPVAVIQREVEAGNEALFFTAQYENEKNVAEHYATTGVELAADLGRVDYLFGGLGTSGSTRGAGERLKEANPQLQIIGVVAESSDYIPGIRTLDEVREVGLFDRDAYEAVVTVSSGQAVDWTIDMLQSAGVMAGPTSGACLYAAVTHLRDLDDTFTERKKAVFYACDRFDHYLSYMESRSPHRFGKRINHDCFRTFRYSSGDPVETVSKDKAPQWIAEERPLVIDTRGNMAFTAGHIAGSVNITDDLLEKMIDGTLPFSHGTKLLFVCPVGEKSKRYSAYLSWRGYDAHAMSDGIVGWRDAGHRLERSPRASRRE